MANEAAKELRRMARKLRRDSKAQRALCDVERDAHRHGEYAAMLSGRSIGLEWAADACLARARELEKEKSERCPHCNGGISYKDRRGNSDHMNAHTCTSCHGTGKRARELENVR